METAPLAALSRALTDAGMDIYVARDPVTLEYLTGWSEDGHERFLGLFCHADGSTHLIAPALSRAQAERAGFTSADYVADGQDVEPVIRRLSERWNLRAATIAVDDETPAHQLLRLQDALPAALFRAGGSVLGRLMSRKSEPEMGKLMAAGQSIDRVAELMLGELREGESERAFGRRIEQAMAEEGIESSFCIVGFGPGSAEPHHVNSDRTLQRGDLVLIDIGGPKDGYYCDITRVAVFGEPTARHREIYAIVHAAHRAGCEAARVGAVSSEVDAAARAVIESAGHGEQFGHRLGHGVGRRGHERPNLAPGDPTVLAEGNAFSIEPGIYLPGEFGIRLENLYGLSDTGLVEFNRKIPSEIASA